jgi:hypothetical protein
MVSFLISEIGNIVSVLNMLEGFAFCTLSFDVKSNAMKNYVENKILGNSGKDVEEEARDKPRQSHDNECNRDAGQNFFCFLECIFFLAKKD